MTALRALRAEWTKLRTLSSTGWLLLGSVVTFLATGAAITRTLRADHCADPCLTDPVKLALAGVRLGQAAILILAVMAVTAEYSSRTITPALQAVPRRAQIVAGKLAIVVTLALAAGTASAALSLTIARITLRHTGFEAPTWSDPLVRRAAFGTVLYLGLIAALGVGLGLLLRDTAAAVTAALAVVYGAPAVAAFVGNPRWAHRIHQFSAMDAGLSIQATRNFAAEHIGPWAGLGILAAYAGAALLGGMLVFCLRDAR